MKGLLKQNFHYFMPALMLMVLSATVVGIVVWPVKTREVINKVFRYFMQGVMLIVPFAVTVVIVVWPVKKLQAAFAYLAEHHIPALATINKVAGLNIGLALVAVTLLGYITSNFIIRAFISLLESVVLALPFVNLMYSYIKESTVAFVDKFDQPVLVYINKELGIQKIGFITQDSLVNMGLLNKVSVYLPHSYSFSGELLLFPKDEIELLHISTTDALRMILTGGLAEVRPSLLRTRDV